MFDLSLAETSLTMLVALLVIGPKELPGLIRGARNLSRKSKQTIKQFTDSIMEMDEEGNLQDEVNKLNSDIKKIVDLEGNLQENYDISDIMVEIKKPKTSKRKTLKDIDTPKE